MSKRQPRFEVVRSDAGWFARFVASNGKEVWRTSETYTRRRRAVDGMNLILQFIPQYNTSRFQMREVDERGKS